ncbi:CoA binding domain [Popillia japonica]|uniref:CoA binding domain n=1 Tax=Popillia japonica TaxID=7064 RepID=A0AAW1L5W3_POPJA
MFKVKEINSNSLLQGLTNVGKAFRRLASYEDTLDNLLIDANTKVICQGISGKHGTIQTKIALEYGTKVVAGISKNPKVKTHLDLPVFQSVRQAKIITKPDASIIFVPAPLAKNALIEAIQEEIKLVVCITKGIPYHDMIKVHHILKKQSKTRLLGPHSSGIIVPNICKIGVIPHNICQEGDIGVISRSGTYSYDVIAQITKKNLGQSLCINIGGDALIGTNYVDCLKLFLKHPKTKGIVIIGEIGGDYEEEAAKYLREKNVGDNKKVVVATIVGATALPNRKYGHASAIITSNYGSAKSKIDKLETSGVVIAKNPSQVGDTIFNEMKRNGLIGRTS